ncbi:MAG: glutamate--tRNA ligase family protein [Bryobacteraceae bacterium]
MAGVRESAIPAWFAALYWQMVPRVRFAPSPTGYLHVGSTRKFIFNALSGQPVGPSVFTVFAAIGRERTVARLARV